MQGRSQLYALTTVVIGATVALGFIVYFVDAQHVRAGFAWLMVIPIVLGGARLGVAEDAMRRRNPTRDARRFLPLRGHVDDLLEQIRRINGIAVDARCGIRVQAEASEMMDSIEERLMALVGEIRTAAGVEGPRDTPTARGFRHGRRPEEHATLSEVASVS